MNNLLMLNFQSFLCKYLTHIQSLVLWLFAKTQYNLADFVRPYFRTFQVLSKVKIALFHKISLALPFKSWGFVSFTIRIIYVQKHCQVISNFLSFVTHLFIFSCKWAMKMAICLLSFAQLLWIDIQMK